MITRSLILKTVLPLGLIILGVYGLGHYIYAKYSHNGQEQGMPPTGVKVAVAVSQKWQPQVQATGTLNAQQGVMLKAEAAGRITKINVQSGQTVKAGDILFEINPDILKAQLAAAQAKSDLSTGDYSRAVKLYGVKVLSKQDLDTALANKNADLANVNAVKAQLEQNIVRAPIAGKLGLRLFNLGDYIKQEQPLINLQSVEHLRVDFSIPSNFAVLVKPGDKVFIRTDAYPNKDFQGLVTAIDTAEDVSTRTVAVRADVPNPENALIPGNFVQVTLYSGPPVSYATVPQLAVVYDVASNAVFIIQKGVAAKKPIVIAEQNSQQVAIKSGINVGDQVITEGQLKIGEGSPVYAIH
jgi:membrane fusion protein (multidrug efflux system)